MSPPPRDTVEAAELYSSLGWYPIPLKPGTKECRDKDWRERIYMPDEFRPEENIGLRLVAAHDVRTRKLVAVDLDCQECVSAASLLPPSPAAWGRESKTISQILYLSPFDKPLVYRDAYLEHVGKKDECTLLEIRVDHQSMAPPSMWFPKVPVPGHPGEQLRWINDEVSQAPEIDAKILKRAVQMVATAALAGRYYPGSGARHDWCLALSGALKQSGLTEDEVWSVLEQAGRIGGDGKPRDRRQEVHSTFQRADDDPTAGLGKLAEMMGAELGKPFCATLRSIWAERSPFRMDERGKKIASNDQNNVKKALETMGVRVLKDIFNLQLVVRSGTGSTAIEEKYTDDVRNRVWLEMDQKFHFRPSLEFFEIVLKNSADGQQIHPVVTYLESLKWDGTTRLDKWLITYGGAKDEEFIRAVGAITLIAAVRRVMSAHTQVGVKLDEMLVLESSQGQNKSTALRTLCPDERWFTDDLPLGVDSKIIIERTAGKWIVEAAELMNFRKTQVEHLKSFLSRQVDGPVRLAYERNSREIPRQFIIIGTTNAMTYLRDQTGNRRFWPVRVKLFDVKRLLEDRDQIWAEAVVRERTGESIRLSQKLWGVAGRQQALRLVDDAWEEPLQKYVSELPVEDKQRIHPTDLWNVLGIPLERRDDRASDRLASLMQKLGFRKIAFRKGPNVMKGWGRDQHDGEWKPAGAGSLFDE